MKRAYAIFFPVLVSAFAAGAIFEFGGIKKNAGEVFTVSRGDNVLQIAGNLKAEGYVKSKIIFIAEAAASGNARKMKAGEYDLSGLDEKQIIEKISRGATVPISVSVIPGWTLNDIGNELQNEGIASSKDFFAYALLEGNGGTLALPELKERYPFLEDLPAGMSLEGYLYPDTYQVAVNANVPEIVSRMLDNFGAKLTPELRSEIKRQNKTVYEVVTMASMLEKELKTSQDKKIAAGILWKRMDNGMSLDIDSTLLYFRAGSHPSLEDKDIDSPYNTYRRGGLPAGPICNPGIDSIEAAIHPSASDYWFYLSAKDGTTVFSRNYGEHLINKAKYLDS